MPLAGCVSAMGDLPLVTLDSDLVGVKMLQPDLSWRRCQTSVCGVPLGPKVPPLEQALAELLRTDAEGNIMTGVRIRSSSLLTGIYNRTCLEVRGDLARSTSVVRLPGPHEGHH